MDLKQAAPFLGHNYLHSAINEAGIMSANKEGPIVDVPECCAKCNTDALA